MSASLSFTLGDATKEHELWRYNPGDDEVEDGVLVAVLAAGVDEYEDVDGDPALNSYKVRAIAEGDPSAFASYDAPAVDPPAAPTDLVITETGSSNNDVDWTDNAADEDNFELQRNFERGAFSALASPAADAVHYDDDSAGLPPTMNGYRIRAVNAGGASAWCDHLPAAPSNLSCGDYEAGATRNLVWTLGGANPDLCTGIEVQRNVDGAGWATIGTADPNETTYGDTEDLTANIDDSCAYRVRELNSVGNSPWSETDSGTLA